MTWTTSADLRTQVQRLWDQGVLLRAQLVGEPLFPLPLRLKRPDSKALAECFDEVRQWIRQLQEGEGHYRLDWLEINHRQLGRNQVPGGAHLDNLESALALLGKAREAERFAALSRLTLAGFPELHDWLTRHPLRALEQAAHWGKVLAVLEVVPWRIRIRASICANWILPGWTANLSSSAAACSASCWI